MAEFKLQATAPLNNFASDFEGTGLREVSDLAIISIAVPQGGRAGLQRKLAAAFAVDLPDVGRYNKAAKTEVRLLGLQQDQYFLTYPRDIEDPFTDAAARLGDAGYYTDQSDSWAVLEIKGPSALAALERVCALDLSAETFPNNAVARTVMEHLGVILLRKNRDHFQLMSPRSSAANFLHMLETSLKNVS